MRKSFKESKNQWENEWWERKIDECKAAEQKYDCKQMYKILRDIERTVEEIDEQKHNIPKIEDEEYLKKS